jgi:DUF4097 and DUF4098 domain-containing protein YvlB
MDQTFETPGGLHVEIRIPAGSVRVRVQDTAQTHLSVRGERSPDDFRVELTKTRDDGHRLTVEYRDRGKLFAWHGKDLRVELTIPLGSHVTCDTGSAGLEVTGTVASLAFRSGSGECRFDDVDRDLNVKTASGSLVGSGIGGSMTFNSASGDAQVRLVGGDVEGKTASGDFSLGTVGGPARIATVSGDVEIASLSSGSTSIHAVSGDVAIGVTPDTRVYLDLSSMSGDTVSDLDMSGAAESDGAPDLELQVGTVSGDIRVTRAVASR